VYNRLNAGQPQKKKMRVGLILALIFIPIVLIVLIVAGLLAAIFVPSMLGYVDKSKVSSMNSATTTLQRAANGALTEMDGNGYNISGYYIISSDNSKNVKVPTSKFDVDEFYKSMKNYFADSDKVEWFVVINDGYVEYAASAESWRSKTVGTYPNRASKDDGGCYYNSTQHEKAALSKFYDNAKKQVK
jgi:type II secretory pathway pseudopilin PulG